MKVDLMSDIELLFPVRVCCLYVQKTLLMNCYLI